MALYVTPDLSNAFNYGGSMQLRPTGYKNQDSGNITLEKLKETNPYANQTYNESPWQEFLHFLGFRTERDSFQENMRVQASEYDASLAQMMYENEYNSPINQVARMRAAGLNPDIQGGSGIDSGNTKGLPQDPSTPMQTSHEEQVFPALVSTVMSVFSSAIGIVSNFQGIKARNLQNQILSIQKDKEAFGLSTSVNDYAKESLSYLLPESPEDVIYEDGSSESWQKKALDRAQIFSKNLPKKFRSQFIDSVQGFWNSVAGSKEAYSNWLKRVQNRKDYEIESRTNYSHVEGDLKIISDELGKLYSELERSKLSSSISKSKAEEVSSELSADIDSGINPNIAASAKNASNEAALGQKEIDSAINKTVSRITEKLSKNNDIFSQLLLILLYGEKNNLIPKF